MQGMLDPVIITADAVKRRAHAAPREAMPRIQRAAENYYLRVCPALHDKHCPAVEPTLQKLQRNGALLALAVDRGNLTRIGWRFSTAPG